MPQVPIRVTNNPDKETLEITIGPHNSPMVIKIHKVSIDLTLDNVITFKELGTQEEMLSYDMRYEMSTGGCLTLGCMLNEDHYVGEGVPEQEEHAAIVKGELLLWEPNVDMESNEV